MLPIFGRPLLQMRVLGCFIDEQDAADAYTTAGGRQQYAGADSSSTYVGVSFSRVKRKWRAELRPHVREIFKSCWTRETLRQALARGSVKH